MPDPVVKNPPAPTGGTPNQPPAGGSPTGQPPNNPPAGATGSTPPAGGTPPAGQTGAKGGSIYEAVGIDEPGKEGSTTWPTDWREQLAQGTGNAEAAKLLARYQSPADVAKALLAAQQKIRSGEYKRAMPQGDNPEELKAWREEQGIPESPDGYELPPINGQPIDLANLDEGTKASLTVLREGLHKAGLNKEQGAVVSSALLTLAERQAEQTATQDANNRDSVEDALRAEWGPDYRRNLNMNGALLTQHFGDNMEGVLNARMPNGMRLADSPEFNKFLNAMARANGSDVLFDGDVKGGASVDSRLEEIRNVMRTNINEYYAKGLDVEYAKLLEKQQARAR